MFLRALYPFKKTHPTSMSFSVGDLFVELMTSTGEDKNWYYAMAVATGDAGYIPRNYVIGDKVSEEVFCKQVEKLKEKVRVMKQLSEKERAELLANLEGVKTKMKRKSNQG